MRLFTVASIQDLAALGRRRVPKFAADYLDGGAGDGAGVTRNEAELARLRLRMEPLSPCVAATETQLFDRTYALPIGVAPMGMANMIWPGTDKVLAAAAERANVPYVLSGVGSTSLEDMARVAPNSLWFQFYVPRNAEHRRDLIKRAESSGVRNLVITVDTPITARRNDDIRNSVSADFRFDARFLYQVMTHPRWALAMLNLGAPNPAIFTKYADRLSRTSSRRMAGFAQQSLRAALGWDDLRAIRDEWKGRLLVKGVTDPHAAVRLVRECGADGIWVSNHGGRQLESAPATIEVLPHIRAALGANVTIAFDGGIRNGEDVIKALALGADFVFSGRSFAFTPAAAGAAGADKAFEIFRDQLERALVMMGVGSVGRLAPDWVLAPGEGVRRESEARADNRVTGTISHRSR